MTKQLITLFTLLFSVITLSAQSSDYEAWSRKKTQEYAKWQKLRAETSRLPASQEKEDASSFIDEGFGNMPPVEPSHPVTAQAATVQPATYAPVSQASQGAIRTMRIWVVVVGVADYRTISKLNYTDDDAYRMYAFYKSPEGGSLPDPQIRVLIDEDATRNNVIKAMDDVYTKATANDAIIFYFSGHGSQNAFVTQEYDRNTFSNQGLILHQEIQTIFDKSSAKYKYIIADACHSGSWATKGLKSAASTEQQYYQAFENAKGGFVLMLSSMGNEYSMETSGIRQGIFSHFLIRGLKGEADTNRDGVVSVIELFDFVKSNVGKATGHKQTPVLSGNYQGNPPISIVRID